MKIEFKNIAGHAKSRSGLGYETVTHIYFWGKDDELRMIKDYAIKNFKTYKHDDTVKYGEHELFLWSTDNHFYFVLNAEKHGKERNNQIVDTIKNELEIAYNSLDITVQFGISYVLEAQKIEDFLMNYEPNLDNIQLDKLREINPSYVGFPKLSKAAIERIWIIQKQILNMLEGRKVIINGEIKGMFKKLGDEIVFFKLRARKTFYRIGINNMKSIELY